MSTAVPLNGYSPADAVPILDQLLASGELPEPDAALLAGRDVVRMFSDTQPPALVALHPTLQELVMLRWARLAAEREHAKPVPPAPPPATVDEFMAARIEHAQGIVAACDARIETLTAEAHAIADRIVQLQHLKRAEGDVGRVRVEAATKRAEVDAARDEADAARRALAVLQEMAADPARQTQLAELQAEADRATVDRYLVDVEPHLARAREVGAALQGILLALGDAVTDARAHMHRARELADALDVPRPKDRLPEIDDARRLLRRALAAGILDAGGRTRDFEFGLDVWRA